MLADRILSVQRSPFYSIMELAATRDDCIYLQLGEPDFVTPKHIVEAAKKALDEGHTHYGPDRGAPELRQLIAEKIQNQHGADYSWEDEILVTAGGQAALHIAVMALANPGEEIIILLPHYPPYVVNAHLAGAKAVFVELKSEESFVPDPAAIEQAITDKTKIILVLTPNNPTGSVYPEETLQGILDLARKHNIVLISDEVYETLVFDGVEHKSLISLPDAKDHVVQVNSFSKTYAMTGLRVGYLAASSDKLIQFLKYHHTVNISANVPSQMASITALKGPQDCVEEMRQAYLTRRDMLVERLNDIPGIHCETPKGTFFAFADIRELGVPSLDFVEYLVKEAGVVLTNGSGFNYEGFIRLSYAAQPESIEEALERMKKAVANMPSH
ncbi:pyridoxal phosphate-dependent aminotransferase [Acidobacteria bacterium AH-259-D05]|nr:pyridoxal phosphate-dependent aminotransferase [Acidobacteria bacterium AH-259-D05]